MVEVFDEIDFLNSVLITMQEGASDEKRMALNSLARLVEEKEKIVEDFEKEFCDDTTENIAA